LDVERWALDVSLLAQRFSAARENVECPLADGGVLRCATSYFLLSSRPQSDSFG
jgi:hypothetical protein